MFTRCLRAAGWTVGISAGLWTCAVLLLDSPHAVPLGVVLGISPALHPLEAQAGLTALLTASLAAWVFVGFGPFLVTGMAIGIASDMLRRRPTTLPREISTAVLGSLLLAAWVALYGASPVWVAWDAAILAGVASSAWLLVGRARNRRENGHV